MDSSSQDLAMRLGYIFRSFEDAQELLATMPTLYEEARRSGNEQAALEDCVNTQREQILAFEANTAAASQIIEESKSETESLKSLCATLRSREIALQQKCEQLEKANSNLLTLASQRQDAIQKATKQISALTEENDRLRSQFPSPDRKQQHQLTNILQASVEHAQEKAASLEKELRIMREEWNEATEQSKDSLAQLSASEKQREVLTANLKSVVAKHDELKAERTELKSSLNNSQQLLNEAKEENAILRDSEAVAQQKADALESGSEVLRDLLALRSQQQDQSTDEYNEELNRMEAERDDAIDRQTELEQERDLERQLTIAQQREMEIENASLQVAVYQSALTIAAPRKEIIQQHNDMSRNTRKQYFDTHEISKRLYGHFADRVHDLYDRIDGLVVSYNGYELPRGFGRPECQTQSYELRDLGGVEEGDFDVQCAHLDERPWSLIEHGAPYDGPLVDGSFTRYTDTGAASSKSHKHLPRTDTDFRVPTAHMLIDRSDTPQSDTTDHARLERLLSSSSEQVQTPSPTRRASQSPLFERECAAAAAAAAEDVVKEDVSKLAKPEPIMPSKRGIDFYPLPRPKRTRITRPDDPRLRAPRQPRGDSIAMRARCPSVRGDSYRPSYA
ncbi:hypothetical protein LTR78_009043 [Recurvomyces mirabilis]|uniref:Uncharacterized protein n=1 Tax=Recurvomyces mirabilis TaxID=574656 RepID=A0AAE0TSD9_9PEZI|nr:hypothetical protein LTR78_009043 [Recurvomyces mirabilis]KAK5150429.1 hypothetical protein LTS14_010119 [Recurvomyces mirabilis]